MGAQQLLLAVAPVGGASDPYFANVQALLHFNGSNGSTTITDQIAGHSWTASSVTLSTSSPKFGSASLNVAAAGYVIATDATNFPPGTGDCTYEGWGYAASWGNTGLFTTTFTGHNGFGLGYYNVTGEWQVSLGNGSAAAIAGTAPTVNTWFKWSVSRISGVVYLHIDGVCLNPAGTAMAANVADTGIAVGAYYGASYTFNGKIDEFRYTKGVGRYNASNYTPETQALPDS